MLAGDNQVIVKTTTFNNVTEVAAGNGDDEIIGASNQAWQLSGINNQITANNIEFTAVEKAMNGTVTGTTGIDAFTVSDDAGTENQVSANAILFSNISSVTAGDNADTVSGSNIWNLLSTGFETSGISFFDIVTANSTSSGVLQGTIDSNEFTLQGFQSVSTNSTTFNQVATVNADGGNNTLLGMASADDFYLIANNDFNLASTSSNHIENKVISQQIEFNNIALIDGREGVNRIHGTDGIDNFQLTSESQQLIANEMIFDSVQIVLADGGQDSLIGLNNQAWQVSNADNIIVAQNINFTQIENISNAGIGSLRGSDQADEFHLVSTNGAGNENSVIVNQLLFTNIGTIDGGENNQGDDAIISDITQVWQLTDNSDFSVNGMLISNVEQATALSSVIMGSVSADVFQTTDITNTVIANDVTFSNVTTVDGGSPGLILSYSSELNAEQNNINNENAVSSSDVFIVNSNNNITITQGDGGDSFSQSGADSDSMFEFKNIEVVNIITTGDVTSTSGFEYLTIDAKNLTINTSEDITINDFNISDDLFIASEGDVTFLNDAEFSGVGVSLTGDEVSFRGSLKIASNTFVMDANKLNVAGDIDADVNAERTVATDVGQDINLSIFNAIDIFVASEGSIYRKDEIDNADRLKRLLEETELEL